MKIATCLVSTVIAGFLAILPRITWNLEDRVVIREGRDGFTYVMIGVPEPPAIFLTSFVALYIASIRRAPTGPPSQLHNESSSFQ
jgi:hypothetical protein